MATTHRAQVIDGRKLAERVLAELSRRVSTLRERGRPVRLDAVRVEGDEAAGIFARNQATKCRAIGIEHVLHELPETASERDVTGTIERLNADEAVHAVMVHLPLPERIDTERMQSLIAVAKDVEGVNPANIGNVVYGRRSLVPCTALAVIEMIESTGVDLHGVRCVCVGASNIVGKPIVVLLMRAEATVISTNKYTPDLAELTRSADVLISGAGVAGLIKAHMVKPGAVVVDVGINRIEGDDGKWRTVGDVDFEAVSEVAGYLSPVPGGVGPMTVAMLMRNTVDAAERDAMSD